MCARINTWYRAVDGPVRPWRDWGCCIEVRACDVEDGIWHRLVLAGGGVCSALIGLSVRRVGWGIGGDAVCWLVLERCRRQFRERWGHLLLGWLLCFGEGLILLTLVRF